MAELAREYKKKNTFWRNWGALLILVVFFLASWGGQFVNQMQVMRDESAQRGQEFSMSEFWSQFWASTFENWQSEWLQLATQAVLVSGFAAYLFRTENQEHYKTQLMLEEMQEELRELRAGAKR